MKAVGLSLFLLSVWRHGAASTAEPGLAAPESVLSKQDDTEVVSEQAEHTSEMLPALDTVMASYDQKLESMTREADALQEKLTSFRQSSMARLAHKKKNYQLKLRQAQRENQQLAKSNEELDNEVIRLQHQVAKKAAQLENVQDANRKSKEDMEQITKDLEVVDRLVGKSLNTAKTKAEAVIETDVTVVEPLEPTMEHQEDPEATDPEENQLLMAARFGYVDAMPKFNKGINHDQETARDEELLGDSHVSLLSMSMSAKTPQIHTGLADLEPASLVELLSHNLANLQKQEESSATTLSQAFEARVKRIFHERKILRRHERELRAVRNKLMKYTQEINASSEKAKHVQTFLVGEVNKENNYLRRAKKHLH